MSNLSHSIRRFNRFELKYLITQRQAEIFKDALRAYLSPDDHGNGDGRYSLTSIYYDSPDYRFYWEKMDGLKFRRKLRIRYYEQGNIITDGTPIFVEVKQRLDRVTQKRRVLMPYRDVLLLCNNRQMPEHSGEDQPILDEIQSMLWSYDLHPVSMVHYTRYALVGSDYDIGLRVTFDSDLVFSTAHFDLRESAPTLPMLPPDGLVMEIKVNERIPYWLTELVATHNLKLIRMSKYCRSIELSQNILMARSILQSV